MLSFNIVKRFEGFSLNCDAEFDAGITAIFGPSGSGKTTLLNCLAGLMKPDEGEITFRGTVFYGSSARRFVPPEKRRFGYVFQDSALFPHMSVMDNLRYGYNLTPVHLRKTEPQELIQLLRLDHLVKRSVTNLSGGERQRVALARALATSPDLLLLDEPLASLDSGFRGVIIQYLSQVWRELQTPMIYVSHSISEVMALAHQALVLSDGRVIAKGTPSQILVRPELADIAEFATLENILEGEVVADGDSESGLATLRIGVANFIVPDVTREAGSKVMISLRAGDIILTLDVPTRLSARNVINATISAIHTSGSRVLVYVDIGASLVVQITQAARRDLDLREGMNVYLIVKTNSIVVLDTGGD